MQHRTGLVALLAGELAAVVGLHAVGASDWASIPTSAASLVATTDLDLAMAAVRLVALALTWWCLVTTVLAVVVHARSATPIARARALRLVPAVLRTHVRRGVAGLVVGGVLLGQGAASAAPLPPGLDASSLTLPAPTDEAEALVDDLLPPGLVAAPTTVVVDAVPIGHDSWPAPSADTGAEADTDPVPPAMVAPPAATPMATTTTVDGSAGTHTVQPGDHLWSIARSQLVDAGAATDDATVAAHWRRLVAANLATLPGGDPDVVHPGHVLTLVEVAT